MVYQKTILFLYYLPFPDLSVTTNPCAIQKISNKQKAREEKNIKFIGVRDERTGTHMADGYARASNKPGVIIAGQNLSLIHI